MARQMTAKVLAIGFALTICLSLPPRVVAATEDDFREAAGKAGCEAIPYETEKRECNTAHQEQVRICREFSCNKGDVEKALQKFKDKTQSLQQAKTRNNQEAAENLEVAVKELEDKLKEYKEAAGETLHECYDCLEAREKVQRAFSDASEKVSRETDPGAKQYVPTLLGIYKVGRDEHVVPIQQVTAAADNCKWVSEITW